MRPKLSRVDSSTYEGRNKIYRFAMSRGYESDAIMKTLRKLLRNET